MVKNSGFVLSHNVPLKLLEVQDALADLRVFGHHHPLIESVEKLDATQYIFHEFTPLPFGLKFKFQYPAQIILGPDPLIIQYKAKTQGMGIHLSFQLAFDALKQQTVVVEKVELTGLFLWHYPLRRMICNSHARLFLSLGQKSRHT